MSLRIEQLAHNLIEIVNALKKMVGPKETRKLLGLSCEKEKEGLGV